MKIRILKNPFQLAIGARFKKLEDVLVFTLPFERREVIDMFFVPNALQTVMLDKNKKVVEKKILKPWQIYRPKNKFKYLIEFDSKQKVDIKKVISKIT